MKVRPFLLTKEYIEDLKILRDYAQQHPYTMDDLLDLLHNNGLIAGDDPNLRCLIPFGYCIVFAIEHQLDGPTRHLSISVHEDDCLPSISVVQTVMRLLGFKNPITECFVKMENTIPINVGGHREAVSVWELI